MPYINDDDGRREVLATGMGAADASGELNFVVTTAIIDYLTANGLSYATINDVLGVLSGASKEFYRRVAIPYEDAAIARNGDVYPPSLLGQRPVVD